MLFFVSLSPAPLTLLSVPQRMKMILRQTKGSARKYALRNILLD